jgi:enoyl-CoA hydratase/carnithine racemase
VTIQRILQGDITDNIVAEKRGAIGWLTFNDPQRHNAVSFAMWEAVPVVLEAFRQDPEIRAVVLQGAGGKAFVSGANISQFDKLRSGEDAVVEYERVAETAQLALYDYDKPTIAYIQGYCIGGGLNIALCCDIRIASDNSSFAIPAGKLTAVGPANALEIFLTAARYDAREAKELGLIRRVAPVDELPQVLETMLAQIQANAPLTLRAGKKMIRQLQQLGPEVDVEGMRRLVLECFDSNDYREGRKAFAEKRAPVFTGT